MNPLQKASRTFLQAFLGSLVPALVGMAQGVIPSADWLWAVLAAAVLAGIIAVLTWLMNALEDQAVIPTILGKTPRKKAARKADLDAAAAARKRALVDTIPPPV